MHCLVVEDQQILLDLLATIVDAFSKIAIRLERREQHWAIVVDDNGPGLPDDHTADMPLYSSKPSGSGLGLFIVRSAMEGHNGELTLGVSPSGGTRAVLLLPRQG